ncbi:hypothetical protein TSUD_97830 [Trifolium subterraneum]|uniref:CHY-type domain-containing protein n=1 Tax=Trifolium subterraneum TaxID=3900 RepID=A0A2Z6PCM4_TRISU|nr:hypothetical protein TSUD_97830 [Trifolium subterraneum]
MKTIPEIENFGCTHYRRRCKIVAPCCNEVYGCRHCHNEAKVICSLCDTEQDVQQYCINCGVCMGEYFCGTCKFFDDDISKQQYHCDECGICRTGGKDNFFHCKRCGEYSCPVCSKSICDMSSVWKKLDQVISSTPMPESYKNKKVWILCNDCGVNSHVQFHIVAHKCLSCNSYNTRQLQGIPSSSSMSSRVTEMVN